MSLLSKYEQKQFFWGVASGFWVFVGVTTESGFVRGLSFTAAILAMAVQQLTGVGLAKIEHPTEHDERQDLVVTRGQALAYRWTMVVFIVAMIAGVASDHTSVALFGAFAAALVLPLVTTGWVARHT